MTATTGFSVQTQLSQVLHLSHGGAVAVQLRQLEESPHGLSQRRVPPVGPSDYQPTATRPTADLTVTSRV